MKKIQKKSIEKETNEKDSKKIHMYQKMF